ncbi:WxL domain-containing protein [Isobaculum melis]
MKKIVTASAVILAMIGLSATPVSAKEVGKYDSNATVKFKSGGDEITPPVDPLDPSKPLDPVDPVDPTKPIEPGTKGPLSLDYASSLYFGEQEISKEDKDYQAVAQKDTAGAEKPNYVQVSDTRGTEKGWGLQVKQNGQFKTATGRELTGALITFNNAEVVTVSTSAVPSVVKTSFSLGTDGLGAAENVMAAKNGEGAGTFVYRFGNDATKAESINLNVPGKTAKLAEAYTTTITWSLTDVPGQ